MEKDCYHEIIKTNIFDEHAHIVYDYNHPSLTAQNVEFFLLFCDYEMVGAFMWEHHDHELILFRALAIHKKHHGKGYGKILLELAENKARDMGYKKILLHSRPGAYNFYTKHGYINMDFSWDKSIFTDSIDMGKFIK